IYNKCIRNINIKYVIILFTCIQILMVYSYYFLVGYDLTTLIKNSFELHKNNTLIDNWYFSTYPNNLLLLSLYSKIIYIVNIVGLEKYSYFLLLIVLCINCNFAGFLIYRIVQKITGRNILSFLSYIYFLLLMYISPWYSIPYSDAIGTLFTTLTIGIYIIYFNKHIYLKYVMLGIIGIISLNIKPQASIVFIAIIIYELLLKIENIKIRLKNILLIFLGIIISLQIISIFNNNISVQLNSEQNIGYYHYFKMGLNQGTTGLYSSQDFDDSYSIKLREERDKFNKQQIENRIKDFTLTSYSQHILKKTLINFNNGTFGWYWMAEFPNLENYIENKELNILQNIYYGYGNYYKYFNCFQQSNWLVILLLTFIGIFNNRYIEYKIMFYLSIVGIFLFSIIFESSARYLFTNVPIFIICSMYGLQNLIEFKNRIIYKKRTRNKI
ncbi:hypothetical protein, partial [Gemelliphila palaticanis]